jgi:hypothetical protein
MAENKLCLHLRFSEVPVASLRVTLIIVNCSVDCHLRQHSCENRRVRLLPLPTTRSTTVLNRNNVLSTSLVLFHHDTCHVVYNTAFRWQLFLPPLCRAVMAAQFYFYEPPTPTPNVAQALSQRNRAIPGCKPGHYLTNVLPPLLKAHKPIAICSGS